jgi:hypothetical protein
LHQEFLENVIPAEFLPEVSKFASQRTQECAGITNLALKASPSIHSLGNTLKAEKELQLLSLMPKQWN